MHWVLAAKHWDVIGTPQGRFGPPAALSVACCRSRSVEPQRGHRHTARGLEHPIREQGYRASGEISHKRASRSCRPLCMYRFQPQMPNMEEQELTQRRCEACEGGIAPLDEASVTDWLRRVSGWSRSASTPGIERKFGFSTYPAVILFANAVAWVAERENHHPILELHYGHCIVRYYTHAIGGLSVNDFICAAKVNALYLP